MNRKKTVIMLEIAIAVALAFVLSKVKIWKMPQGGSVTLEMLPLAFLAFRRGIKASAFSGILYGLVSMVFMENAIIHYFQPVLDYFVPALVFILCGFGIKKGTYVKEFLFFFSVLFKFLSHFGSGIIYYAKYAPEGQSVYMYSFLYNITYIIPAYIAIAVIIYIFEKRRLFDAKN